MNSYLFLKNKVQRRIDWAGEVYEFTRVVEDKYHREQDDVIKITLKGLYHQTNRYQQKTTSDGSVTTNRPQPMILCMYDEGKDVQPKDKVIVGGVPMVVTNIVSVQQLNEVLQISLEPEVT